MTTKKKTEQQKVMEIIDKGSNRLHFIYARRGALILKIWILPSSNGEGMWRGAITASEDNKFSRYTASAGGYGYNKLDAILTDLLLDIALENIYSLPAIPQHAQINTGFLKEAGFEVVES